MSNSTVSLPHALSNQDIVVLSREIQAMVEAGVPLDFGLSLASNGLPDQLSAVSAKLAEDLKSGKSLVEALELEPSIPGVYKAVLVAGLQCGRSEEVLEDVCQLTTSLVELKSAVRRGLIYPLIVVGLCLLFMVLIFPVYLQIQVNVYEDLRTPAPAWILKVLSLKTYLVNNLFAIGVLLAALLAFWIIFRQLTKRPTLSAGMWWIPGISGLLNYIDLARTTNILALLTKYECPLPGALRLTAQTSESNSRAKRYLQIANEVEQGVSLQDSLKVNQGFPPFLCWLISTGAEGNLLSSSLSQAARFYRSQAATRANLIRVILPAAALVVVGGGVTLLYGLTIFGPMIRLWGEIGR